MKFNSTYTPQLSLKDTLKIIHEYQLKLEAFLREKFDLIKVTPPIYLPEDSELLVQMNTITRPITFDFGYDYRVGQLVLSHTNWLRQTIDRLKLDHNEGLITESTYIWRDLESSPVKSPIRTHTTVQVKIDKHEDLPFFIKELTIDFYNEFIKYANEIQKKYGINNIYPKEPNFYPSQILDNQMPSLTSKQKEVKVLLEEESFILESPGQRLVSGSRHTDIPTGLYDLKNYYELIFRDRINSEILKVMSIGITASGQQLLDQLRVYDETSLLEDEFYSNLTKQKYNVIEVRINFPRLMMALLAKGHISEVQSGIYNNETNVLADKYKIEVI